MATNNDALVYLVLTRIKGTVRYFVRKPIQAILSGIVFLAVLVFLYMTSTRKTVIPESFLTRVGFMLMIGAMPLLVLMIFVYNKHSALLYLNDANYLFVGPFNQRQVKNYLLWLSFQQMITIGVGATLYFSFFFNFLIFDGLMVLKAMVFLCLSILLTLMYFNYYYLVNNSKECPSKINTWLPVLTIAMMLVVFITSNFGYFDVGFLQLFENTVSRPWFQWVPFVGWASAVQANQILIGYGFRLVFSIVYIVLFYKFEGDYYEKATQDAVMATVLKSKMIESKNSQETLDSLKDSKKLSRIGKVTFLKGGWSLFSRQLLQMMKTKQLLSINQLMILGIYTTISLMSGDAVMFKLMMISVLFTLNLDSVELELKRHFIYLIPDSDFKKAMAVIGVKVIQSFVYVCFTFVVSIVAFKEPLGDSIFFSTNLLIVSFLYLSILLLSMRFIGFSKNQLLKILVTIVIYAIALIPTMLVFVVLYYTNNFTLEIMTVTNLFINFFIAFIILHFASGVLSGRGVVE